MMGQKRTKKIFIFAFCLIALFFVLPKITFSAVTTTDLGASTGGGAFDGTTNLNIYNNTVNGTQSNGLNGNINTSLDNTPASNFTSGTNYNSGYVTDFNNSNLNNSFNTPTDFSNLNSTAAGGNNSSIANFANGTANGVNLGSSNGASGGTANGVNLGSSNGASGGTAGSGSSGSGGGATTNQDVACSIFSGQWFWCILQKAVYSILWLCSWVLWVAGVFFNYTISFSLYMADVMEGTPIVEIGWGIFRDIANICFIFVLLFIAISTILGIDKYGAKTLLSKVIIAAILINFSLFFAEAIVDASNILALQFYGNIQTSNGADGGISAVFINSLGMQTIFNAGQSGSRPVVVGGNAPATGLSIGNILTVGVGGSILILVTAFVFFAAALMFIYRSVALMIIMTLSPLAFIGSILPGTSGHASKWWDSLFKNAFFAPIYMAMIYVVIAALQKGKSGQDLGAFLAGDKNVVEVLYKFVILIAFMIGALIIANQLGAYGSKGMMDLGKKMKGGAQGALGRGAVKFSGVGALDKKFENIKFGQGVIGSTLRDFTTKPLVGNKFGSSKSYNDVTKESKERKTKLGNIQRREKYHADLRGANPARALREIGNDVTSMDASAILAPNVVGHLSSSQIKTIMKSDKWSESQKSSLRTARTKPLNDEIEKIGTAGATPDIRTAMGKMHPSEIAELPMSDLTRPEVAQHLTVAMMNKIMEETTAAERGPLSAIVRGAHPRVAGGRDPIARWLNDPAKGGEF